MWASWLADGWIQTIVFSEYYKRQDLAWYYRTRLVSWAFLSSGSFPASAPSTFSLFVTTNFCTSTYRNSFLLSAIYFWYSLPRCVVYSDSLSILKLRLFEHLFSEEAEPSEHFLLPPLNTGHAGPSMALWILNNEIISVVIAFLSSK